jgi:hypothetical protein
MLPASCSLLAGFFDLVGVIGKDYQFIKTKGKAAETLPSGDLSSLLANAFGLACASAELDEVSCVAQISVCSCGYAERGHVICEIKIGGLCHLDSAR